MNVVAPGIHEDGLRECLGKSLSETTARKTPTNLALRLISHIPYFKPFLGDFFH